MSEQLILEVIENHHQPFSVGQGEKSRFKQKIFMHAGGPFPVEAKMNINNPVDALPIGKYELMPSAFRIGKYGDVEINQWELRNNLIPVSSSAPTLSNVSTPAVAKSASKLPASVQKAS